jgi:hypothetical protein
MLRSEGRPDLSGASRQSEAWVELGEVLDKVLDQFVVEAALGGGDEEGAADC